MINSTNFEPTDVQWTITLDEFILALPYILKSSQNFNVNPFWITKPRRDLFGIWI